LLYYKITEITWQAGSYGSMVTMATFSALKLFQHNIIVSKNAMPARQLCQHGSFASMTALPVHD
jgi:hypothetical protein